MAKQRDRVKMTTDEVAGLLGNCRKVQLATISPDGYPHLVTMYYTLVEGKIAFWTYRTSQKALNLARDPRISCLVETGEAYFDLRGVLIQGTVEIITDPEAVYKIGLAIGDVLAGGQAGAVARQSSTAADAVSDADAVPAADAVSDADAVPAADAVSDYVASAARKRYAYVVEPRRVISWDHSKLVAIPPAAAEG